MIEDTGVTFSITSRPHPRTGVCTNHRGGLILGLSTVPGVNIKTGRLGKPHLLQQIQNWLCLLVFHGVE